MSLLEKTMQAARKVQEFLGDRSGPVARRKELRAQILEEEKTLNEAIDAALAEQRRLKEILAGFSVHAADKAKTRRLTPLREELRDLDRRLRNNPPAQVKEALEETQRLIDEAAKL